jgi:2'-5' RNA ligase
MSQYHSVFIKKENTMKLFIASPVILDDYASIQEDFTDIIEGKWVEEKNLHLTWVFLGEVKDEKPVIDKLTQLSSLEQEIEIAGLGYFGRPPKIFLAKSEKRELYDKAREFRNAGFDLYRFKPHITFCRIKTIHDYKAYREKCKTYREKILGKVLPEINLYQSTLSSKGAAYRCRYKIEV